MIKNSNNTKKAKAFTVRGAAALIIAALMAALLLTGCPHGGGGNSGNNSEGNTGTEEKILIEYDAGKIVVWTKDAENKWKKIPSGTEVAAGTWLELNDRILPENKVPDKWLVNTKVLDGNEYTVNAADAIVKDGKKVITVTYTIRPAEQVKIKFDETKINVKVNGNDGVFKSITTGTPVYEKKPLWFNEKNLPEGQTLDKWKVNTKELAKRVYKVNRADAVTDGSNKFIEVTYTTKPAEQVKIKFDETKIKVRLKDNDGNSSPNNYGYTRLRRKRDMV